MQARLLRVLSTSKCNLSEMSYWINSIFMINFIGTARCFSAPKLTGFTLKLFVWLIELPIIGSWLLSHLKEKNKFTQVWSFTVENPDLCIQLFSVPHMDILDCHMRFNGSFLVFALQMLQNTVIPETPMFRPEFPPQGLVIYLFYFFKLTWELWCKCRMALFLYRSSVRWNSGTLQIKVAANCWVFLKIYSLNEKLE